MTGDNGEWFNMYNNNIIQCCIKSSKGLKLRRRLKK